MKKIRSFELSVFYANFLPFGTVLLARTTAALCSIGFALLVGLWGGVEELGKFAIAQSVIWAIHLFIRNGANQTLVKILNSSDRESDQLVATDFVRTVALLTIPVSLVAIFLMHTIIPAQSSLLGDIVVVRTLALGLPGMIILSLSSGYLWGHHKNSLATLSDIGGISGAALILCLGAYIVDGAGLESASDFADIFVLGTYITASIFSFLAVCQWMRTGKVAADRIRGRQNSLKIFFAGWPIMLAGFSIFLTQAGSFSFGGMFLDDKEVGLLRSAERLAIPISFCLSAIDFFIAPKIASISEREGIEGVGRAITRILMVAFAISLPIFLVLSVLASHILDLMGPEFVPALPFFYIMALAHVMHACLGNMNMILLMSGREEYAMRANLATLILAVIMYPVLTQSYGAYGFAIAYFLSFLVRDVLLALSAWRIVSHRQNKRRA